MSYCITGLAPESIDIANAMRFLVDERPGFPCRITLEDAPLGATVLLVNFTHLDAPTPYRASHAIFVREDAVRAARFVDAIPPALAGRLLSVRAYDDRDLMCDAAVVPGADLAEAIERMWRDPQVSFLHVHTAARGCYLARVDRA